jgi:UDP:flavonoid glycosyltransferase YjiC (YdhE family)
MNMFIPYFFIFFLATTDILILIVGSRGSIQPFIAFGKSLQEAGHHVRLSSHINFRNLVTENGLEYYPLKGMKIAPN